MPTLKELRLNKKLTQEQLADELKVSPKTYGSWERGFRNPKPSDMQRIEDYFKVPKEDIFFKVFSYEM